MHLSDILLISDIDGTLLPGGGELSGKNREAIHRFQSLGGNFALASGRAPCQLRYFISELGISLPAIVNNGAAVYDFQNEKPLWSRFFPKHYREILNDVCLRYPKLGVAAFADGDENYVLRTNQHLLDMIAYDHWNYQCCNIEQLPDNICKLLFVIEWQDDDTWIDSMIERGYPGIDMVNCGGHLFEMMAKGVNKGTALPHLALHCNKSIEHTVMVGDYINDIEAFRTAALGVAVGNAVDSLKAVASMQVASCEDDGVAELIEYLISQSNK